MKNKKIRPVHISSFNLTLIYYVHDNDDNAHLGGAEVKQSDVKVVNDGSPDKYIYRSHMIARHSYQCIAHIDKGTKTHPKADQEISDHIDRLIKEISVARAFDFTEARHVTVQRVAKPVDGESEIGQPKPLNAPVGRGITNKDQEGAKSPESRQLVWRNPVGQLRADRIYRLALDAC